MRRHLLLVLTLAILLPSVAILLTAGIGFVTHEHAMRNVARSYVEDLAESVAARIELGLGKMWGPFPHLRMPVMTDASRAFIFSLFSWGFSMPGWVAVVDEGGRILTASPGAEELPHILPNGLPVGSSVEAVSPAGDTYTVAAYPIGESGWLVVAAVSWEQLMGPMLHYGTLWALMVGLFAAAGVGAFFALWKWLIGPLRDLETEVSSLRWGEELPGPAKVASVFELIRLRSVLRHLAQTAIEKQELMRRSVQDLVRVQEGERSSLARDLHDGPLQGVTALIQQLRLAEKADSSEEKTKRMSLAQENAQHIVRELRGLCDELSPPWLDLGLSQALTEMGERLTKHLGVRVSIECDHADESLADEQTLALFRVAQESASNAVRHGKAALIEIRGFEENGRYVLEIEDDGSGFVLEEDPAVLRTRGHRGLANMAERMSLVGGTWNIRSTPGKGTLVRAEMPLPPEETR